jgi:hypothetical protein
LHLIAWDSSGKWLLQVDTQTLAVRGCDAVKDLAARSRLAGVTLASSYALAVPPDGQRLLVADGTYRGVAGIAVVGLGSRPIRNWVFILRPFLSLLRLAEARGFSKPYVWGRCGDGAACPCAHPGGGKPGLPSQVQAGSRSGIRAGDSASEGGQMRTSRWRGWELG